MKDEVGGHAARTSSESLLLEIYYTIVAYVVWLSVSGCVEV
jgi:hypothetical protein